MPRDRRSEWTPERRAAQSERMKALNISPSAEAKSLGGKSGRDPVVKAKRSEGLKRHWADGEGRANHLAAMQRPEVKAKLSAAAKRQWEVLTPEQRTAQTKPARTALKGGHMITRIEAKVMQALNEVGVSYNVHFAVGDFVADVYVPSRCLDVECDGSRFHDDPDRELLRDTALWDQGIRVLRLSEVEITAGDFTRLYDALMDAVQAEESVD